MKKNAFILLLLLINTAQVHAQVEPLIQTAWHQNKPYNAYCPDGMLAGCVAIAMAQVMNYYRYPSHGIGKNLFHYYNEYFRLNLILNALFRLLLKTVVLAPLRIG